MYYLIDGTTKKILVALPSKSDIVFLSNLYNKGGRYVYVSHLTLLPSTPPPDEVSNELAVKDGGNQG